jgi:hypothetical protein
MKLAVWVEAPDGLMVEAGVADVEGEDQSQDHHQFVADDVSKNMNNVYVQLWYGLECVASSGAIKVH